MSAEADRPRGWKLLGGAFIFAIAIHLLHEAAHMLTAVGFGVSGVMSTNTVRYLSDMSDAAKIATTGAGPALMVVFALIAARSQWRWAPTVLFVVFVQRLMAAIVTALGAPNDEARLSSLLGLPEWSFFALTLGLIGFLFVRRYRQDGLGWTWLLLSFVGFSLGITVMVFGDGILFRFRF